MQKTKKHNPKNNDNASINKSFGGLKKLFQKPKLNSSDIEKEKKEIEELQLKQEKQKKQEDCNCCGC